MRVLLITISLIILTSYSYAQQPPDGRWLPDGTWQPQNKNATIEIPGSYQPSGFPRGYEFTDNIWINWEPDTHLSYESIMAFYSGVAAGGNNYVHVSAMSVTLGDAAYYVRSTNGGLDWENGYPLYDGNGPSAVDIQVLADSNYAYVIFTNGSNNYVMYSSDYGENWSACGLRRKLECLERCNYL
jgi:hypothetical protein